MSKNPALRLSVIVPIYNRQESGLRTLASIVRQNVGNIDIVAVDDGSSPSFTIPPYLAEVVRLQRHPENLGASAARNTGIAAARGEWIALLDSDDYWLDNTLQPRLELAERYYAFTGDPLTVFSAGFTIDNQKTAKRLGRIPIESADPVDFSSGCCYAPGATLLARKEAFERIGPYDPKLRRLEDLDWLLRLVLAGGQVKVWDGIAAVVAPGPKTSIAIIDQIEGRLRKKYGAGHGHARLPDRLMCRLRSYLDVERASTSFFEGNWFSTVRYLLRSWLRVPRTSVHLRQFWRYVPVLFVQNTSCGSDRAIARAVTARTGRDFRGA